MSEAQQRKLVVAEARSWLGTPYHHQADIKGVGVDCAMILVRVYQAAGVIPAFDPRPYPTDWHLHRDAERYLGWLEKFGHQIEQPAPGDVAVWRFGRCFSHGAVCIGDERVIHSYIKQGVVIASMAEQHLASRPVKYFTLWGNKGSNGR